MIFWKVKSNFKDSRCRNYNKTDSVHNRIHASINQVSFSDNNKYNFLSGYKICMLYFCHLIEVCDSLDSTLA